MTAPGDYEGLRQDYERPGLPYRCGREGIWQEPCRQGPNADGSCGGTSECRPFKRGQRWECRRPPSAGGLCADGPRPDGGCARTRPPCLPSYTWRRLRGRLVWLTVGAVVAALMLLSSLGCGSPGQNSAADPGPLSAKHARFTQDNAGRVDCSKCHFAHGKPADQWLAAALEAKDWAAQCAACHVFHRARAAHNTLFAGRTDLKDIQCTLCHTEHKGAGFDITRPAAAQCNACHRQKFAGFAAGHPAFPADFPYERRPEILFDHASHFRRHFKEASSARLAPKTCAACHDVQAAGRMAPPMNFEKTCAACHADKIKNDLALIAGDASLNEPTSFEAYLLSGSTAPAARAAFYQDVAKSGGKALADLIAARGGGTRRREMLLGANDEMLKAVGADWASGKEFKLPAGASLGHWYYDDGSKKLFYAPREHADTVLRAWADFSLAAAHGAHDARERKAATAMLETLFPKRASDGPGACGKCHALAVKGADARRWRFQGTPPHRFARFSHRVHVGLPELSNCTACHEWRKGGASPKAEPAAMASFAPIRKETCLRCHAPGKVRSDCLLCHTYHAAPSSSPALAASPRF